MKFQNVRILFIVFVIIFLCYTTTRIDWLSLASSKQLNLYWQQQQQQQQLPGIYGLPKHMTTSEATTTTSLLDSSKFLNMASESLPVDNVLFEKDNLNGKMLNEDLNVVNRTVWDFWEDAFVPPSSYRYLRTLGMKDVNFLFFKHKLVVVMFSITTMLLFLVYYCCIYY